MSKAIKWFVVPPPDGSAKTNAKRQAVRRAFAIERAKIVAKIESDARAFPRDRPSWPVTNTLQEFGQLIDKKPSFSEVAQSAGSDDDMRRALMATFILNLRTNINHLSEQYKIAPAERCDNNPFKEAELIHLWYKHACKSGIDATKPTHSDDFTSVNWWGISYTFRVGHQADAVRVLWAEYDKGGHGLHEKSIGQKIESAADHFRLAHVFRKHPAWGAMIVPFGRGEYRLARPAEKTENHS